MANKIITVWGRYTDGAAPLVNFRIELWDIDSPDDIFLGEGITDSAGLTAIEVTEATFNKVFVESSADLYYKIFSGSTLVSNTRDAGSPDNNPDILASITNIQDKEDDPDEPTTDYTVSGAIVQIDGTPATGNLQVQAYDRSPGTEVLLGQISPGVDGGYSITYTSNDLAVPNKEAPDLLVRVVDLDAADPDAALAESPIIANAQQQESINLVVGEGSYRGPSEYQLLDNTLASQAAALDLSNIPEKEVTLMAGRNDITPEWVDFYLKARYFANLTGISPQVFYGLMRREQPANLQSLLSQERATLKMELEAAAEDNVINLSIVADIETLLDNLAAQIAQQALNETALPAGEGSLAKVAAAVNLDADTTAAFLNAAADQGGLPAAAFWQYIRDNSILTEAQIAALQLNLKLSAATLNNMALASALQARSDINDASDLANLTDAEWDTLTAAAQDDIPADIAGDTTEEKRFNFATLVKKVVANAFPTRVLARQIRDGSDINDTDIDTFFTNNPSFEFRTQSVRTYLKNNPSALSGVSDADATRATLESYQRTFRLTPTDGRYDQFKTLYNNNIRSAWDVKRMGKKKFVTQFATALGGEAVAQETYRRAANVSAKSMAVYTQYASQYNSLSTAVFNTNLNDESGDDKDALLEIPNLASLFQSQDFCACKQCRSVLSPAAFLVDLFEYLKEGSHTDGSTALDKLKIRRPDLTGILLHCDNTNTVLPYIDLVNELLEELIAPTGEARQTTWTAAALRAQPEHLNLAAYDATTQVVYPITLPFHLWNAEGAAYLNHLGVPRYQLADTFTAPGTAHQALHTAQIQLGMSTLDLQVFDTTAANAYQLYGFSTNSYTSVNTVAALLSRLQIAYADLVLWLQTRLVNATGKTIAFAADSCALETATLSLTNAEYGALNRYIRLARKTGWHPAQLDRAVAVFGESNRAAFITHLAGLRQLQQQYTLKPAELLTWHGLIDTYAYGDDPSYYSTLFLNPALHNNDTTTLGAFALNEAGTEVVGTARLLTEESIAAVVAAATALRNDDLALLVSQALPSAQLSLAHLSHLYRIASFCRATKLTVTDYLVATALLGESATLPTLPRTPQAVLDLIDQLSALQNSRLTLTEQAYLLLHQTPVPLTGTDEATLTVTLRALQTELKKYSLPADTNASDMLLQTRIGLTKLYDEATALEAQAIIEQTTTLSDSDQQTFIADTLGLFADAATLQTQLVGASMLTDLSDRVRVVAAPLMTYVSRTTLYQYLAAALDLAETTAVALLDTYTYDPLDDTRLAADVFLSDAFVRSDADMTTTAQPAAYNTYARLMKAARVITRLRLTEPETLYLLSHTDAGWTDFANLPLVPTAPLAAADATAWQALLNVVRLQRNVILSGYQLADLLTATQAADATLTSVADAVAYATGWKASDVYYLLSSDGYNYALPADYADGTWLRQLEKAFAWLDKTGASAAQAWTLTAVDLTQPQANLTRQLAKARYSTPDDWLAVAATVRDPLRAQQRNALRDYLLAADDRFDDANDLFAYYLIDTEMAPCMLTSRIKIAISSVQLWVQRIQLNLEPGLSFAPAVARQWKWRKNYRVWEANRKVFLFPENWIEPELRDDKSIFFTELENELQQAAITDDAVETAYLEYLNKLHQVAHLEVVSTYEDEEAQTFHVMARTYANPHVYYYRQWAIGGEWTPWERVDLEIESDHFVLVHHNRRLYFFWANIELVGEQPSDAELEASTTADQTASRNPALRYHIRLGWTEQRHGQWLKPQMTNEALESAYADREKHFLMSNVTNGTLRIDVVYARQVNSRSTFSARYGTGTTVTRLNNADSAIDFYDLQGWILNDSTNTLEYDGIQSPQRISLQLPIPQNGEIAFTKFREAGNTDRLELPRAGTSSNLEKYAQTILNSTPGTFQITISHQYDTRLVEAPFFYSDGARTYFVTPTEDVEEFIDEPQPSITKVVTVKTPKTTLTPVYKYRVTPQITKPTRTYIQPSSITPVGVNNFYQGLNGSTTIRRATLALATATLPVAASASAASTALSATALRTLRSYDDYVQETVAPIQPPTTTRYLDKYVPVKTYVETKKVITVAVPPKRVTIKGQKFRFYPFYHPYTLSFLKQVNRYGAAGLLDPAPDGDAADLRIQQRQTDDFQTRYTPDAKVVDTQYPVEQVDFDYNAPYAVYNWELFYHGPLMLATTLSKNQRFEEAQQWFHYLFDPTQTEGPAPQRYWRIKPFYDFAGASQSAELLKLLNEGDALLEKQVEQWEQNPFKPHVIARMRVVAYMKTTVMKYLDNLIAWGDSLFRQDTIESINEASQIYLLAAQLLGRRPVAVERNDVTIQSYDSLEASLDSFSNAWVNLETELKVGDARADQDEDEQVNTLNSMLFFCVPNNDKMLAYWDTVGDRLFKIRHCQNIEGVTRSLALFAPPIDPALLVRAAAAGLDLGTVLQDVNAPLPLYRFDYMLQRAYDFCNDVKGLGAALLSALEKKDAESLSLLRAGHQVQLLTAMQNIRTRAIEEAREQIESLTHTKAMAQLRQTYYLSREYMNNKENQQLKKMEAAAILQAASAGVNVLAGALSLIPDFEAGVAGAFGSPFVTFTTGGNKVGLSVSMAAQVLSILGQIESFGAAKAGLLGGYDRRRDDWRLQADLATTEIEQIDRQLAAAEIRLAMAERELETHDLQTQHAQEEADYFEDKYTHQQLYTWMVSQLSSVYFQTFQLAYDLAKKAERNFQFELAAENTGYIRFGYWDSLKKGLLAGEQLHKDLRRLEVAYLEQNRREYELTKHIAVSMLNPQALIALRETGTCEVMLPEVLFDMDYPGHYMRRLKGVSITIPCVTGAYTNISCELTLLSSRVRKSVQTSDGYAYTGVDDTRFIHYLSGTQRIATSSAQHDSGLFEFNFRDERYLPFERMGAVSHWRMSLPEDFRQFDYDTISDVVLHLNYTARDGGAPLKTAAANNLRQGLNLLLDELADADTGLQRLFSFEREFPNALYSLTLADTYQATVTIADKHLPRYLYTQALTATEAVVMLRLHPDYQGADLSALKLRYYRAGDTAPAYTTLITAPNADYGNLPYASFGVSGTPQGTWTLELDPTTVANLPEALRKTDAEGNPTDELNPDAIDDWYVLVGMAIDA